jgi:hypothetical protein
MEKPRVRIYLGLSQQVLYHELLRKCAQSVDEKDYAHVARGA